MDESEWIVDEDHYATLALPVETARKYFDTELVEMSLSRDRLLPDERVLIEVTQLWNNEEGGWCQSAHELLTYWEIDTTVLGEDGVEWYRWSDG
jgi:hypothetical protein